MQDVGRRKKHLVRYGKSLMSCIVPFYFIRCALLLVDYIKSVLIVSIAVVAVAVAAGAVAAVGCNRDGQEWDAGHHTQMHAARCKYPLIFSFLFF